MLGVCLLRGAVSVALATSHFTLAWTHSIEKTRWEEVWRVTPAGLVIDDASILTSGAGMEPPEGARWSNGAWHYRPTLPPLPSVTLAASEFTADHTLCALGRCQPLHEWVPGQAPVRIEPCEAR